MPGRVEGAAFAPEIGGRAAFAATASSGNRGYTTHWHAIATAMPTSNASTTLRAIACPISAAAGIIVSPTDSSVATRPLPFPTPR